MSNFLNIKNNSETIAKIDLGIEPEAFANEILKWCQVFGFKDITNLKFQKLFYYCYAVSLWNIEKMPFTPISGDGICGSLDFWALGPVSPVVYHELKLFGRAVIARDYEEYNRILLKKEASNTAEDPDFIVYKIEPTDKIDNGTIGLIFDSIKYTLVALGNLTAKQLVDKTHSEQSAWHEFYKNKSQNKETSFLISKILEELACYSYFDDLFNANKNRYAVQ